MSQRSELCSGLSFHSSGADSDLGQPKQSLLLSVTPERARQTYQNCHWLVVSGSCTHSLIFQLKEKVKKKEK